jgi:hypothetical protein
MLAPRADALSEITMNAPVEVAWESLTDALGVAVAACIVSNKRT